MTTILEKTAGLVAFVQAVDSGSFSGAGRFIGSSPSAERASRVWNAGSVCGFCNDPRGR